MFSQINRFFDIDNYLEKRYVEDLNNCEKSEILKFYKFALNQNIKAIISEVYMISRYEDLAGEALVNLKLKGCVLTQKDFEKGDAIYIQSLLDWSDAQLEDISMIATKKPIYINFYRSLQEAGEIDKLYGKSPAHVLEDFGFLDRECYLIGCNYLDKEDLEVLSHYPVKVVLTPISDMICGNGVVNILPFINSGIQLLFGTGYSPIIDIKKEKLLAKGNTANLLHMSIYDKALQFELEKTTLF